MVVNPLGRILIHCLQRNHSNNAHTKFPYKIDICVVKGIYVSLSCRVYVLWSFLYNLKRAPIRLMYIILRIFLPKALLFGCQCNCNRYVSLCSSAYLSDFTYSFMNGVTTKEGIILTKFQPSLVSLFVFV